MVVSGLLCDPSVTPYKVAKFAEEQGYYAGESGTSWTLMSEGVQSFGIWGEELGLSRSEVFSALESGCPIICSMRPRRLYDDRTLYCAYEGRKRKNKSE